MAIMVTGIPLRFVPGATTTIILTPARPMATTDRAGSSAASSSARVPGIADIGVEVDIMAAVGTTVAADTTAE
jgi:hypothetical protein